MMGFTSGFLSEPEQALLSIERYGVKMCSLGFVLPKAPPSSGAAR